MLSQVESLVDGQTSVATWLPHHHDMGLGIHIFALTRGITCTFMSPAHFVQRPLRWLEAISRYRATGTCSPHFALDVCNRRANDIGHSKLDLSSLRCMIIGAEPLLPKVIADFADNFARYGLEPACITPCYGLAESTVLSTATPRRRPKVLRVDQASYRKSLIVPNTDQRDSVDLVSCGSTGRDHGVAICDPDTGRILPEGSVGEVWLNGPSIGSGYWCMPEASRFTFNSRTADGRDGYLRTGDLGCLWEGELYITGRTKDLIIIRGRNLYPQDIENVIRAGPNALNNGAAVAFAEMHDDGERIAVVVELDRHSRLTPDELAQGVRRLVQEAFDVQVGRVLVVQRNAIPKTSSGKLRRQHCRGMVFNHDIGILAEAGMLN
jgi:acyl-CoA synthetase (AMP-forming)/AMP-acid ligase II